MKNSEKMRMTTESKLTPSQIKDLPIPATGAKLHPDGDVKGMALRITAKNERAFVLTYRINGTQKSYTFGWPTKNDTPEPELDKVKAGVSDLPRPMNLRQARREARNLRDDIKLGKDPRDPNPDSAAGDQNPTLSQYAKQWMAAVKPDIAQKTAQSYQWLIDAHIVPTLGSKQLRTIKRADVKALLAKKRKDYSKNTVRLIRAVLSTMFAEAWDDELVPANPTASPSRRGSKRSTVTAKDRLLAIRPFSTTELNEILTAAKKSDPEYYPAFFMLARTGLRPGELIALKWEDADFSKRECLIERASSDGRIGPTKTGTSRRIELSNELVAVLEALRVTTAARKLKNKWPDLPEWVFTNSAGNPLDISRLRKHFASAMKTAKVSGHRLYDLRHTYASAHLAAGTPITYVAEQLGHAKPTTTLTHYARWLPTASKTYADTFDTRKGGRKKAMQTKKSQVVLPTLANKANHAA
jgi:integrase